MHAPAFFIQREDEPTLALTLWPHRSLTRGGFRHFMIFTGVLIFIPVLPVAGFLGVWLVVVPFLLLTLFLLWLFIERNYYDGRIVEELRLWPDLIAVQRTDPDGSQKTWEANPYWVRLTLHPEARPENYLTMRGEDGREIELGAFLSPEERVEVYERVSGALK
ncbi:DUF2244 domain-containing protein [Paracoccaceae bacterium GXU_MW_L88]